jgi:hypothetical protein
MEMTGDNNENYEGCTFIEIPFRKRKCNVKIKRKAFLSTLVNENSRPRAKRRNTTPNCAKVSTCSEK